MRKMETIRNNIYNKNILVPFFLSIFIFILDRITKIKIIEHQTHNNKIFVNDYLNLELVWNTGIAFGLLSIDANIFYHLISLLIFFISLVIIYMIIKSNFLDKIFFSLILGGAVGNFYDRIIYFAVPDFIDFHLNQYHWFTFNIADIFISIGIILLIIKDLILNK
jgi:signal peptidase II